MVKGNNDGFSVKGMVLVKKFFVLGAENFSKGFLKTFAGLGQIIVGLLLLTWFSLVFFGRLMINHFNKSKGNKKRSVPGNYRPNTKSKRKKDDSQEEDFLSFHSPLLEDLKKETKREQWKNK